ncbi:uncharacterized protein E0L32_011485 [Thyridium curvatum]|uniref:Amidase domain-containing protein n=1 Tax=Thyridium curvatum TaxID=1093900 RepID=A0A507BHG0_9PEZI|nr:uncharacterized protein E0L32_011485 [Thyridium curvatum]TPX18806.1 hypothetical protein E0L32_011485 [Thyridium curvatum]
MGSLGPPKRRFFNYPRPLKAPDVAHVNKRNPNPPLRGFILVAAVWIMDWIRPVREIIWRNAGFGDLRSLWEYLQDYEPLYDPTVVPLDNGEETDGGASDAAPPTTLAKRTFKFPEANRYYSVEDYHELFLSGELTPTDVANALLPLIRRDTSPKGEHSIAWFDTKVDLVLRAADESTARYKAGRPLGLLDGVPTAVKDEYDMDGYVTTLGSKNDYTGTAVEDDSIASWCVRRLEAEGCVILGKLSMVEFGLDTPGNNPNLGTPPNPYNPAYYTGGSSSGSAYAVAAGLIPIALGSDGGGSIRIPSSFCSVFGLKPSHARISFDPGHNHSYTCCSLGPIAADVRSLAIVYSAIAQPHPSSQWSPELPAPRLLLQPSAAAHTKTLGIPEAWFARAAPAVQQLTRSLLADLVQRRGYRPVPISIPFAHEGQMAHAATILTDAATALAPQICGGLTPTTRILLALGRTTPATDFLLAQKLRRLLAQHLAALWAENPGMLIATPVTACAGWPLRGGRAELRYGVSDGDRTLRSMEYVWLANFCGLPALSVPAGYVVPGDGEDEVAGPDTEGKVPVGLMVAGEWGAERSLLQFGLDAEEVGAERRCRPPIWVDVVERARKGGA